jgi:SsrA-binding protein
MPSKPIPSGITILARNRRALFQYELGRRFEAGLVLTGSEVKALRSGKVDLSDAYAAIEGGEVWIRQMNLAAFNRAYAFPHAPRRSRKCLLHRREIATLSEAMAEGRFTVIPLDVYLKGYYIKITLAIAKGKKLHDKRAVLVQRIADREAHHAIGDATRST